MIWEEFVLSILAIVIGGGVLIVGIAKITDLIKTWITRDSTSQFSNEEFSRLAKAFMQHKKDMTRRIENLEAILSKEQNRESEIAIEEPGPGEQRSGSLSNDLDSGSRSKTRTS